MYTTHPPPALPSSLSPYVASVTLFARTLTPYCSCSSLCEVFLVYDLK
jgi:hypothetical protein